MNNLKYYFMFNTRLITLLKGAGEVDLKALKMHRNTTLYHRSKVSSKLLNTLVSVRDVNSLEVLEIYD